MYQRIACVVCLIALSGCAVVNVAPSTPVTAGAASHATLPAGASARGTELLISRSRYRDQLEGFWLGQCIANWTGLVTEMDRVAPPFYTDADWKTVDQKNMWGKFVPHTRVIDLYVVPKGKPWGADDDTDMEYLYQSLLEKNGGSELTARQIQDGWLTHIYSNNDAPLYKEFPDSVPERENFLWVSNERAYELMQRGVLPSETSAPANNPETEMIDAQLTTEIFGVFAPGRPDVALKLGELPVRVTASGDAAWAARFYIAMHALAAAGDPAKPMEQQVFEIADQARAMLPAKSLSAAMYDFVKQSYLRNPDKSDWESTRDAIYLRYQKEGADGYLYRNPFDSGINFAASLVSLFYGQGDLIRTIQIGTLSGWDSDNPTATWGGMLGLMMGKSGVQKAIGREDISDTYWIHRTRRNFPDRTPADDGEDSFPQMATRGLAIIDKIVLKQMGGSVDLERGVWKIPLVDGPLSK